MKDKKLLKQIRISKITRHYNKTLNQNYKIFSLIHAEINPPYVIHKKQRILVLHRDWKTLF